MILGCGSCLRFAPYETGSKIWLGYCRVQNKNVSMADPACSQYIDKKHLEVFERLFVNRDDTYAIQKEDGRYRRVNERLSRDVSQEHLRGVVTVGSYQLNQNSDVKDLIFDLDPDKLEDPKEAARQIIHECVDKPTSEKPRFYRKAVLLEASRYPNFSYHIRVMFALKTPARAARWLGVKILEHANINPKLVEIFPKQGELKEGRQFGNFVKLPLGKHQVARKWSRFLDRCFEPLPNDCLFDVEGASFQDRDIERILSFEEKKHIQLGLKLPKSYNSMNDTDEREIAMLLGRYWRPGYRNQLEMAFLGWCLKKGVSYESTCRIVDAVTTATRDEEKKARLDLVKYHYETRREMTPGLKGSTGIKEVIREVIKR